MKKSSVQNCLPRGIHGVLPLKALFALRSWQRLVQGAMTIVDFVADDTQFHLAREFPS
jgi:hypothetical protein